MTPDTRAHAPDAPPAAPDAHREGRRAAAAAFLGGTLEYYDFFIYATAAALVFPHVLFPESSGASGTLMSLATFGVAYVARPLGALVLGHFGDRAGRKRVMVACLVTMGLSTLLIGCLPSYGAAGIWSPVLLVVLRLAQGVSAGGETAGASSLTVEHAPADRRATYGSWTMNGISAGLILASLVFMPLTTLSDEALYAWGWRIPFWVSILVLVVAYLVRRNLSEPEVFEEAKESAETAKLPLVQLFRSQWRDVVRLALCSLFTTTNTIVSVFALSYAVGTVGLDRSMMLWVTIAANVLAILTQTAAGRIADQVGRRPVFIVGCVGCAGMIYAYFAAIATGSVPLIFAAGLILTGLFYSLPNGIYPAFFAEMFTVRVRYTGMAVGLQLGLLVAGFAPAIGSALTGDRAANWVPVATLTAVVCAISAIAAWTARETYRIPLKDLGTAQAPAPAPAAPVPAAH